MPLVVPMLAERPERDLAEDVGDELLLSFLVLESLVPVGGRELEDAALRPARQEAEEIAQVGPGLELVELAACEQRNEGRVDLAAIVASDEEPVLPPDRFASELTLAGVVLHGEPPVVEELLEADMCRRSEAMGLGGGRNEMSSSPQDRLFERRTLAVHRIQQLDKTSERFIRPKVDPEVTLRPAFGIYVGNKLEEVEIAFSGRAAREVEERTYHPDEEKEHLADGRLRYRLKAGAKCELLRWVQSYGGEAELISPADWRDELRAIAQQMAKRHRRRGAA